MVSEDVSHHVVYLFIQHTVQVVSEDVCYHVVYLFIQVTVQVVSEDVSHRVVTYLFSLRYKWSVKMLVTVLLPIYSAYGASGQ